MKKLILIAIVIIIVAAGCVKTNDPGGTTAKALVNEWWVTVTVNGNDFAGGHVSLTTYNSAPDQDSIWVDDLGHIWNFKVKAKADYKALTFSTTDAQNEYYDSKVTLTGGKILPNAGHSKTGIITDSLYIEAKFNDDPDNLTYVISGTARTFRAEDDY